MLQDPKIPVPRVHPQDRSTLQGRHKKQSGGHGQFGDVWIKFRPNDDPTDTEFHFEDAVVGGAVPRNFIPAVEKGLRDNIKHGVLAGYPGGRPDRASCTTAPTTRSTPPKWRSRRLPALRSSRLTDAMPRAARAHLSRRSAWFRIEYMGDIIGDMNKRRGRIMGMDQVDGLQRVDRRGAAGRNVQVRHRPALHDAGARLLHHDVSSATRKFPRPMRRRSSRSAKKDEDEEE